MADNGMVKFEGEAVDILTMRDMPIELYRKHITDELFFVDHHDVFRSMPGGFPLAVTREQFDALRAYLDSIADSVGIDSAR